MSTAPEKKTPAASAPAAKDNKIQQQGTAAPQTATAVAPVNAVVPLVPLTTATPTTPAAPKKTTPKNGPPAKKKDRKKAQKPTRTDVKRYKSPVPETQQIFGDRNSPVNIEFTARAWFMVQRLCEVAKGECSCYCTVHMSTVKTRDQDVTRFLITEDDIYIPDQTNSGGSTEFDDAPEAGKEATPSNWFGIMQDIYKRDKDGCERLKLWLHTHGTGRAFWSNIDEDNIERLVADMPYLLSIVIAKDASIEARLDVRNPLHLSLLHIGVHVQKEWHQDLVDKVEGIYRVRSSEHAGWQGGGVGTWYDIYDDDHNTPSHTSTKAGDPQIKVEDMWKDMGANPLEAIRHTVKALETDVTNEYGEYYHDVLQSACRELSRLPQQVKNNKIDWTVRDVRLDALYQISLGELLARVANIWASEKDPDRMYGSMVYVLRWRIFNALDAAEVDTAEAHAQGPREGKEVGDSVVCEFHGTCSVEGCIVFDVADEFKQCPFRTNGFMDEGWTQEDLLGMSTEATVEGDEEAMSSMEDICLQCQAFMGPNPQLCEDCQYSDNGQPHCEMNEVD